MLLPHNPFLRTQVAQLQASAAACSEEVAELRDKLAEAQAALDERTQLIQALRVRHAC